MLNLFFWILIGSMTALAATQLLYIVYYRQILRQPSLELTDFSNLDSADLPSYPAPKVAIVLCLRGPDPTLPTCLKGLLKQRYPNFDLHLIVDSDDDPVIPIVTAALQTIDSAVEIQWHTVIDHRGTCSLKCSALITAVRSIESQESQSDIVAFVDADALVDPDWLTRLVAPLLNTAAKDSSDKNITTIAVGATTGNRWFEPTDNHLGSRFRAAWNAAALPQMQIYQVAWGGALAMKLETIQKCDLLDRWSQAFCEDTMLAGVLQDHGMRVERVPELIVVNQESTPLAPALSWISRQLLTVRLHHRAWPLILIHALLGGVCFYGPLVFLLAAAPTNFPLAAWAAIAWCVQLAFNTGLLECVRKLNVNAIKESARQPTSAGGILNKFVVAIALQSIYPFLAVGVAFQRRVSWRGIDYQIGRHGKIEMLGYVPYSQIPQKDQHSIR